MASPYALSKPRSTTISSLPADAGGDGVGIRPDGTDKVENKAKSSIPASIASYESSMSEPRSTTISLLPADAGGDGVGFWPDGTDEDKKNMSNTKRRWNRKQKRKNESIAQNIDAKTKKAKHASGKRQPMCVCTSGAGYLQGRWRKASLKKDKYTKTLQYGMKCNAGRSHCHNQVMVKCLNCRKE